MSFKLSNLQIPPPENEYEFENLCLDLYKSEFGDKTQKIGSRGQSQNGVDISCSDQHIGIQCKKKELNKKVTEKELKTEVEKAKKFQPSLKRFILATTCKRDAKIQETARLISEDHKKQKLFSVEIHSWDEIKSLFDKHPKVYKKYYSNSTNFITPDIVSSIQSDSRHEELNRIRDLIDKDNKPNTALKLLEKFKNEKWGKLEDKEKYRVLTNMACIKMNMKQEIQASELFIQALQFNKEDENANVNCALAYYIIGDIEQSKKYIKKTKKLNSLNTMSYIIEVLIKDKEKQPLNKIVSSIPKNIKTKHQIAHVLSHISIKRKEYGEAKKWLNIFYTGGKKGEGWKNTLAVADYADMSLKLILKRQDVFSGRRIPDSLKDELEKAINIYNRLITDSQYSELRQYNPNWHFHYALALELNGELNKAISVLEEGIRKFPEDDFFKTELGRLFMEKGGIKKSISILENQLGLQVSETKDDSNYADNLLLDTNKINLSDKTFHLTLILSDLYFQNEQEKNAYSLLNSIETNESINEENKLKAQQYKIFRLINFKKIKEAEELLKPLFQKNENNLMNLILYSKIEAVKENLYNEEISKTHRNKKIQYLKRACDIFKNKEYDKEILNTSGYEKRERLSDIENLFQELYFAKMYRESETLLEEITDNNLNHPDIFKLLHVYFENGKNKQAIELAKKLFKKFPQRVESVNTLFLIYESLGNRKTAIQYYEKFFEKNPKNDFIRIELALAYIYNQDISKAKKLLKDSFNLEQLSAEQTNHLSSSYAKIGAIKKALEILYKYIEKNPKELEIQNDYFSLITFLNHQNLYEIQSQDNSSNTLKSEETKLDQSFLQTKKVEVDCYVQIKDIESLEETDLFIEEDADIYTPDHELSKTLLDKKQGEIILFCDKKYKIIKIQSKYVLKYQEIAKETEKRFPSKAFVKSVSIPHDADVEKLSQIFKKMQPNISKQYEILDELFDLYTKGEATIGCIAKISGRHSIEIIRSLITSTKSKWISAVPAWEKSEIEKQELLDTKTDILVDLSSLIMIHQLKIEKYIQKSKFRLCICQSTIDSLKEYIKETAFYSKDGLLTTGFDKEGSLKKNFISAEIIKQDLNFWMKIKTWAEDYCSIKPLSEDHVLSREERSEKENLFGKHFFDSLLAVDNNSIFLCEDAILRRFAELEYSISGMRLFDLIEYFEKHIIIDNSQAVQFKAQLVRFNQTYIPIDHNILLNLLKSADYSVNDMGFQKALYFLSSISNLQGVVNVIANFLIEICQAPSLSPYSKQVIVNKILDKASVGRQKNPKEVANQVIFLVRIRTKLLPFLQNEICRYIKQWLRGKIY